MRKLIIFGLVTASILSAGTAPAQISAEHVQAGTLTCDISGGIGFIIGSQKALNCSFVPTLLGPPEFYSGVINKLGVDLGGTRGGVMVWAVYAPTTRAAGFLAGTYAGASAELTVGGGIGANILVGGSYRTVQLQPLSVREQTGINVAAGIAEISCTSCADAGRPRAPASTDGATIFLHACRMGLEGIVSKRLSAPCRSGPSRDWIKVKNPDSPAMIRAREAEW